MSVITIKTNILPECEKQNIMRQLEHYFSKGELRSYDSQMKTFNHSLYNLSFFINDRMEKIGIMLWWEFRLMRFIEYLCVEKENRRKGIGSSILQMCSNQEKITVLEVEKKSQIKKFYEKNGYEKNRYVYDAIILNESFDKNEYDIYSYGRHLTKNEFDTFLSELYQDEYKF